MHRLNIGIFGGSFCCPNFGVGALTISQCEILNKIALELNTTFDVICYEAEIKNDYMQHFSRLDIKLDTHTLNIIKMKKKFSRHDIIIDLYGGDSFSDIYSKKGFVLGCSQRILSISKKQIYIIAPQTIGPFSSSLSRKLSEILMNKAKKIFCRDNYSIEEVSNKNRKKVLNVTDLAFRLPYSQISKTDLIGINVSGLLWNSNILGKKSEDYKATITKTIKYCVDNKIKIAIVPHVNDVNSSVDGDYAVSKKLVDTFHSEYVKLAPCFKNPVEAKTYISQFKVFIGSRMHATIAAASIGIPTIPVSYSKKFKGVFNSINYRSIVEIQDITPDVLIKKINAILLNYNDAIKEMEKSQKISQQKIIIYDNYLHNLIEGAMNEHK